MLEVAPLPATTAALDERAAATLRRLLGSESAAGVLPALDERDGLPSDLRTLALGARLALDGWQQRSWTVEVLAAIKTPSPVWRSVLLAVDGGVRGSPAALGRALDDAARAQVARLGTLARGSLPAELRIAWMREWQAFAAALLEAAERPLRSAATVDSRARG